MPAACGDLCGSVLAETLLVVGFSPESLAVLGIGSGIASIVSGVFAILSSVIFWGGILGGGAV